MDRFSRPLRLRRPDSLNFEKATISEKVVSELSIEVSHTAGASIELPPDNIFGTVNVIHTAGLEGEYDWFKIIGSDFVETQPRVFKANRRETLTPPLLIPLNYLRLSISGVSFDLRVQSEKVVLTTSFRLLFIDQAGAEDVRYSQVYKPPKRGHREIRDVIAPRLSFI